MNFHDDAEVFRDRESDDLATLHEINLSKLIRDIVIVIIFVALMRLLGC